LTIAIYPGSFDPVHYGHIDIAKRAAKLFDTLIWAAYDYPNKNLLFSVEERVSLMRQAAADTSNITVMPYHGLSVEFARRQGASVMVRGLRITYDFEVEYQMAPTNRAQAADVDTICLMTSLQYAFVSSSTLKEIASANGSVADMAPPYVIAALKKRLAQLGEDRSDKIKLISLRE
jgi:pantetheine-phosphate adenylyltransferase